MDEYEEIDIVSLALRSLYLADNKWMSNYAVFTRSDERHRILWWRDAKKQAAAGVPAMQELVLKVIELRLTR